MSLSTIILPTDKEQVISDNRRRVRQSEKGLSLPVFILDQDGWSYDLTDKTIAFYEKKDDGNVVIDNVVDSPLTIVDDAKKGKFSFELPEQCYTASGKAWFEISKDGTVLDSTKAFFIDLDDGINVKQASESYISSAEKLNDSLQSIIADAQKTIDDTTAKLSDIDESIQKMVDEKVDSAVKTSVSNTIAQITDSANQSLADLNTKYQEAINNADTSFSDKLTAIQKDYDDWKTKTVSSLNDQVKAIIAQVDTNNDETEKVKNDLSTLQTSFNDLLTKIGDTDFANLATKDDLADLLSNADAEAKYETKADAQQQAEAIDQKIGVKADKKDLDSYVTNEALESGLAVKADTKALAVYDKTADVDTKLADKADKKALDNFAKVADVYDKATVDSKVAEAGKVKTVNSAEPDEEGNVTVDAYTTEEVDSKLADKADTKTLADYDKTADVDSKLELKADKEALDNFAKAADVYDKATVDSKIADKADVKTLVDYDKTTDVDTKLADKADKNDLSKYALLTDIVEKADLLKQLSEKAAQSDLDEKADKKDLADYLKSADASTTYATKEEQNTLKTDLTDQISTKASDADLKTAAQSLADAVNRLTALEEKSKNFAVIKSDFASEQAAKDWSASNTGIAIYDGN